MESQTNKPLPDIKEGDRVRLLPFDEFDGERPCIGIPSRFGDIVTAENIIPGDTIDFDGNEYSWPISAVELVSNEPERAKIVLELGATTTGTKCGCCKNLRADFCGVFNRKASRGYRLGECIAAENDLSQMLFALKKKRR